VAAGWKAAIIERKLFGGTCVNTGCTPTKTLVASAFAAHVTRRLTAYLLDGHGDSSLRLPASLPAEFREPLPVGCCDDRHKTASGEARWQKRRRSDAPTVKDEIAIRAAAYIPTIWSVGVGAGSP